MSLLSRVPRFSKKDVVQSESEDEGWANEYSNREKSQGSDDDEDEEEEKDDEMSRISFGALRKAQQRMEEQGNSSSDEDDFFETETPSSLSRIEEKKFKNKKNIQNNKKKSKHAPSETSSKKPVRKIRDIPGLKSIKDSTLYTDIRFDPAYGKSDLAKTRQNYKFLDEYRQKELKDMEILLKENNKKNFLSGQEFEDLQYKVQSLRSRIDTLKNRDLENQVIKDFKNTHGNSKGKPIFLKNSDKRKLIQKAKFEGMKSKQREKVMERKKKKRLGKEFKQMEFM
ncbi:hypothetical protein PACTADRAFT_5052 [Pachysolen tannophilus NRRL Y-2460]|uniref:rRNA biogenesis protein RRP36 n=1 Tax=Pachysolen tannophilus NRRL Y-2460 TaxID=669874 RepID=A0A1E4TNG2_PACTA|nr:hypothetical protein PACTADRAFT_5052 [Pachysolen tannophilus NRRL Y-2460]